MPDTATRETTARLSHARISPPKVRQVLELIRGQDVETARTTLRFCERSAAREVGKLLDSAVANAEHNNQIPEDELFVTRAHADDGPTLKRWRPRARGRGVRVRKRTSHVTIVLARFADDEMERRRQADAQTGRGLRRAARRRPAELPPAEPDVDVETDADETPAGPAPRPSPAKASTKKTTAKKTTAKRATSTAKKAKTKKATTKKAAGTSTKKATPRKAPAKRPGKPKKDED